MPVRPFEPPRELPAPFGRYQLLKLLGRGGMGAVYLAHDSQLDRKVALKIPLFDPDDGSQVLQRFYREARAAATLRHPNICPVYDVGDVGGAPYLTMAYIEGKPLTSYARGGKPMTTRQSAILVRRLALALAEAHRNGVIHRDLKPDNIMIDRGSEPVVMDFGLARRARGDDTRLTQKGSTMGTPAYMPPEQVSGEIDQMGPGCDIYSLGVILYELLAGRLPFTGDMMAMLAQVLLNEPPPPSHFRQGIDPALEAICLKAMAKTIGDRYHSMTEMAAALQEYLRQPAAAPGGTAVVEPAEAATIEAEVATDTSPSRERLRTPKPSASPTLPTSPPSRPRHRLKERKRPVWQWVLIDTVAVAVVIALVAWLILHNRGRPRAAEHRDHTEKAGQDQEGRQADRKDDPVREQGPTQLFNGKDLSGWHLQPLPEGTWTVQGGHLTGQGGRTHLFTDRGDFENFHLLVEARINDGGNSGVFFRAAQGPGNPKGYEAQIAIGKGDPVYKTGSLYGKVRVAEDLVKPDEWFTQEVIARGNHIIIKLNGAVVVNYVDPDATNRRGHIALQHSNPQTAVEFRRVEITEFPPGRADDFTFIFNGKDLTGWEGLDGYWTVRDGILRGHQTKQNAKQTFLIFTGFEPADFELHARYRFVTPEDDSGIQFRSKVLDRTTCKVGGYQANCDAKLIYDGSIYDEASVAGGRQTLSARGEQTTWDAGSQRHTESIPEAAQLKSFIKPGDWNEIILIARGNRINYLVNGHLMTVLIDESPRALKEGVLALQLHVGLAMEVQFKDLAIRRLE
jgi:serine/threonine protein kinase